MTSTLSRHLLDAARRGDPAAWRDAWLRAERRADRALQDELLAAVPDLEARRRLLAPTLVQRLAAVADLDAVEGRRARGRSARRLVELLSACGWTPYVSRSQQWGDHRIVHIGLCGAPSHMRLSPSSARWDLVRGQLCGNCQRALRALDR